MIEYDFAIAVENAEKQGRRYRIEFPRSCVLFLRSSGNTPDYLEADVIFPDGKTHVYSIPAIKMADYTKDHIFEKNLLMLLPFYIMRYEKKKHDMRKNLELLQILLDEYDEIRINLEKELTGTGKAELYTNLTKLIVKIADHIFEKEEDIRKGIGDVMGGKVLELESERLKAEGEARLGTLINRLIQDQRTEEIQIVSTDPEKREQLYKEYGI